MSWFLDMLNLAQVEELRAEVQQQGREVRRLAKYDPAAVAELIEAADGAADLMLPTIPPAPRKVRELACARLRAALARVQGGAA